MPEPVVRTNNNIFPDSEEEYPTQNNLNQTDFSHTKPIVIESDISKLEKSDEADSANHSFDDGVDVVDGLIKTDRAKNELGEDKSERKPHGNSVDSGISNNINETNGLHNETNGHLNVSDTEKPKPLRSRVSDLSLKESEGSITKDSSSDDDRFESDPDLSPRLKIGSGIGMMNASEKRNGISLNLKLQSEMR